MLGLGLGLTLGNPIFGGGGQDPANWPSLGLWFDMADAGKANGTILANRARPGGVNLCTDLTITCGSEDPGATAGAFTTSDTVDQVAYALQAAGMSAALAAFVGTKSVIIDAQVELITPNTGIRSIFGLGKNDGDTANRRGIELRWNGTTIQFLATGANAAGPTLATWSEGYSVPGSKRLIAIWDRRSGQSGREVDLWANGSLINTYLAARDTGNVALTAGDANCKVHVGYSWAGSPTFADMVVHDVKLYALTNLPAVADQPALVAQMMESTETLPAMLEEVE